MKGARGLLVYGYEPSGHSAAAFAIEEAGRKAGLSFFRVEIASDHHPAAGPAVARGYHALLRWAPSIWGSLYQGAWARSILRAVRAAYLDLGGARRLRQRIGRSGAQVVVCPQASIAAVLSEARRRGELDVPVVSVLTDYGVHPFWAAPSADMILAPDEEACAALARLGVSRSRLRATGIPIHPAFASAPGREAARRVLGLPSAAPVVLLTGGGKGLGPLGRTAAALLERSPRAHILVLCGVNDGLRASFLKRRDGRLRVFGSQPPGLVATMMAASDLHMGKTGGLSSAESLAMGLPLVFSSPAPGQERENARRLTEVGAAIECPSPRAAADAAARLLGQAEALALLRAAAASVGRPHAASDVVREISLFTGRAPARRAP